MVTPLQPASIVAPSRKPVRAFRFRPHGQDLGQFPNEFNDKTAMLWEQADLLRQRPDGLVSLVLKGCVIRRTGDVGGLAPATGHDGFQTLTNPGNLCYSFEVNRTARATELMRRRSGSGSGKGSHSMKSKSDCRARR